MEVCRRRNRAHGGYSELRPFVASKLFSTNRVSFGNVMAAAKDGNGTGGRRRRRDKRPDGLV